MWPNARWQSCNNSKRGRYRTVRPRPRRDSEWRLRFPFYVFLLLLCGAHCDICKNSYSQVLWLTPVIPATQEAEITRTTVQSQSGANSSQDTISEKNPSQKRAGGVAQGLVPEFKAQYRKKKKKFLQELNLSPPSFSFVPLPKKRWQF
jgi:hypothetical protein